MPRRATYIKEVLAQDPRTLLVDTGNLCGNDESQPPFALRALKKLGYTVAGMGEADFRFLDIYLKAAKDSKIEVVNVTPTPDRRMAPYVVKRIGSVRVALVGFGVVDQAADVSDINAKRIKILQEARKRSDVLVAIDKAGVVTDEWLRENAESAPDFVAGSQRMQYQTEPVTVGRTRLLPTNKESKHVGLLKIQILPDKQLASEYTQKHLTDAVVEDPEIKKMVDDFLLAQQEAQQKRALEIEAQLKAARAAQQANGRASDFSGPYFDSKSCAPCHQSQYNSWAITGHAKAVSTLEREKALRPDCLICHSERYRKIVTDITRDTTYKQGVECASCHMQVLPHGTNGPPKSEQPRITLDTCRTCHTRERSPEFENRHNEYWDKVKH